MAEAVIAEAFFTTLIERIFDMLLSGEVKLGSSRKKLDDGMRRQFKTMLLAVNAVLNDAEKKQISDPNVRQWLDELKDTMFDAEDLAYEMETEALLCKIEGGPSVLHQVTNFFSSRFSVDGNVEDRIVKIFHTLEGIVEQKHLLPLTASQGIHDHFKTSSSSSSSPQVLLPVEEESYVYGRDHDKAVIVNQLLSDEDRVADANKISVIPIVGMGGIEKTTLARLVYNDVNVMNHFELKAWVTVSQEFDVFTLTKTVFEAFTKQNNCKIKYQERLQSELKKVIEGKKFFTVLDNVWNENWNLWDNLKSQFNSGEVGSKIIVTTRSKKIGSMMGGNVPNHYLGILSKEDSWKLFAKHAFQHAIDRRRAIDQDFEEVGRGIVGKCNGLPLAIKSIGGLLSSRYNIFEWKDILDNDMWKLQSDILPTLWLSYHYLPPHLKRCFAYCSIFSKDFEFPKEKLILLWMAEGLLQPQASKIPEEIGEEYFNDLTSRSFFHRNEHGRFTMHDLHIDLATFVSGEFSLRLDDDNDSKVFSGKTRYLSSLKSTGNNVKKLEEYLSKNKVLRTLLFRLETSKQFLANLEQYLKGMRCLRVLCLEHSFITTNLDLIGSLKLLRYLDLSHTNIKELPDTIYTVYNLQTLLLYECIFLCKLDSSIGNLKKLRYLDMSYCGIKEIPDTFCDLHNLRTLKLVGCELWEFGLPADLSRLVNLRHLDFSGTKVPKLPPQICKLKHLQHLSNFVVNNDGGRNIKELGNLQDLRGCLRIVNIEKVQTVGDVWEAKLKDKKHITGLKLVWKGETEDSEKAREVLEGLQTHTNVQMLEIKNYQGTRFPSWIGHHSYNHMVSLSLLNCRNCCLLPQLGQLPSLKKLMIEGLEMVERIGDEFYGYSSTSNNSTDAVITPPFKSLESLCLEGLRELKEWKEWSLMGEEDTTRAFSQLKSLKLSKCPNIKVECLPSNLPSSTTLSIEDCKQPVASLQAHQLPWLGTLKIRNCWNLVQFPPQGGLPSNNHTISVECCDKLELLGKQGWPSNLKSFFVSGCKNLFVDINSFPEETQLPATLTCLKLMILPKLKSLNGKALQHLLCLQQLTIEDCSKLQCLPEEGLPHSLSELNIKRCGSLIQRCKRDTGEDWPKVAHIPRINISTDF